MSDDTETEGVRVYDRPGSADRPPYRVVMVVALLLLTAAAIVGYLLLR